MTESQREDYMQETGLLELFKLHLLNTTFTLNFHKQGKNHTIDNTQHAIPSRFKKFGNIDVNSSHARPDCITSSVYERIYNNSC